MTPAQERAKRDAQSKAERPSPEQIAAEKFAPSKCIPCNGRGWALFGKFPTLLTCPVCEGTGKST